MGRHAMLDAPVTEPIVVPRTSLPSGPLPRRVGLDPGAPVVPPPRTPRWRRVALVVAVVVLLAGAGAVALTTIRVPASSQAATAPAPAPDPYAYLTQNGTFARYFAGLDQVGIGGWRTSPRSAASAGVETCNAFAAGSSRSAVLRSNRLGVPAAQAPAFVDVVVATICPEYPNVTRHRTFTPEGLPG